MRMMVKKVGEPVKEVNLPNTDETLSQAVGGYIEAVYLDKGVILWCNEEGKLNGLPFNCSIGNVSLSGDIIMTADNGEGNSKALTNDQIDYIKGLFNKPPTAYEKWIDTFFAEKAMPVEIWTFTKEKDNSSVLGECFGIHTVSSDAVIAVMRNRVTDETKIAFKKKLIQLDFGNYPIMPFLKYIAEGMVKMGVL
jgi:hypothetical protein